MLPPVELRFGYRPFARMLFAAGLIGCVCALALSARVAQDGSPLIGWGGFALWLYFGHRVAREAFKV